jgi:hypothetical protein
MYAFSPIGIITFFCGKAHVEHSRTRYKNLKTVHLLPLSFCWYFAIFPFIQASAKENFLQNWFFKETLPLHFLCGVSPIPLLLAKGLSGLSNLTLFSSYFYLQNSFQDSPVQSWKKWKQQKRILHVNLAHQEIAVWWYSLSVAHLIFVIALTKPAWSSLISYLSMKCLAQEHFPREMAVLGHHLKWKNEMS